MEYKEYPFVGDHYTIVDATLDQNYLHKEKLRYLSCEDVPNELRAAVQSANRDHIKRRNAAIAAAIKTVFGGKQCKPILSERTTTGEGQSNERKP